jgi:NADH dehydrogenase
MHRVFVTGGTGFVGRSVIQALRAHGHVARCLVRRGSEGDLKGLEAIERVEGDVLARGSLPDAMSGCDAIIHLVGIIRERPARGVTFQALHVEATENVIGAAVDAGVRRLLHMSALGTHAQARSRYYQTKWQAEEAVRRSDLDWTIIRPSIIYGPGDRFVSLLARLVRRLPVVPVIGSGEARLQPVSVHVVAEGFVRGLDQARSIGQTYDVGGPEALTFNQLLDAIALAVRGRPARKLHIPVAAVHGLALVLDAVPFFPVTVDQLVMLQEDNTCDPTPFLRAFDLRDVPLRAGLEAMLAR